MVGVAGYPFADTDGVCGAVSERGFLRGEGELGKRWRKMKEKGVLAGGTEDGDGSFNRWNRGWGWFF